MLGMIGKKIGMTRVFVESGQSIPVTVLDVSNNRIVQIKTRNTDGYTAVQIAYGNQKAGRIKKAESGHFARAGVEAGRVIREFSVDIEEIKVLELGHEVSNKIFELGEKVDVTGITIGKGFAGTIKRHHFSSNRASHGNSKAHRKPGSIGMAQDPGRVFPGKKMAGRLGGKKNTTQNLEIIRIDGERSLIYIKGAVSGAKGGVVLVRPGVKQQGRKNPI
ncbi:MAG: 50S ribosomal protein L3 [Nitrosomonas sp.]|jgi:large subunit ribosomal protein L3|nr:50S ribosomal protein L3 [Nitrosomonas sp.]